MGEPTSTLSVSQPWREAERARRCDELSTAISQGLDPSTADDFGGWTADAAGRVLVEALHANNRAQWIVEDRARAAQLDDGELAECKRRIDALNSRRHELIESVDRLVAETLEQSPEAEPHTETVGMMIDRLSVMALRLEALRATNAPHDRMSRVEAQRRELAAGLRCALLKCAAGEKRFSLYYAEKIYGASAG